MKKLRVILLLLLPTVLLLSCASSRRIINLVAVPIPKDWGILMGKMVFTNPSAALSLSGGASIIPSFKIADLNNTNVVKIDNTSMLVLRGAKDEVVFFASVPRGLYILTEYWWFNTTSGNFLPPRNFEVSAQAINYIGDITISVDRITVNRILLTHIIQDNIEEIMPYLKEKFPHADWPIKKNLIY